ncbi:MAG TPA: hypothetical protein PKD85_00615 [Saprospiraceae bacterium]|nr:hypothetical protein [Saprospiraceae bacterium]
MEETPKPVMSISLQGENEDCIQSINFQYNIDDIYKFGFEEFKSKVLKYYPKISHYKIVYVASIAMVSHGFKFKFDEIPFTPSMVWNEYPDEEINIENFRQEAENFIGQVQYPEACMLYAHCLVHIHRYIPSADGAIRDLFCIVLCALLTEAYDIIDFVINFNIKSDILDCFRMLVECRKSYKGCKDVWTKYKDTLDFHGIEKDSTCKRLMLDLEDCLYNTDLP